MAVIPKSRRGRIALAAGGAVAAVPPALATPGARTGSGRRNTDVEIGSGKAGPLPAALLHVAVLLCGCRGGVLDPDAAPLRRSRLARPAVGRLLSDIEAETGLQVEFRSLPGDSFVIARYGFDPQTNTATVLLRPDWDDVDVAHELTHMRMELVDGFAVLAWRRGVERTPAAEAAFGRVRSYVDDEVVHARLVAAGFALDGEVLRPSLFDDIYTKVPRYLEEGRARPDDGMAHLDAAGYGELARSAFLVQAELILDRYGRDLPAHRTEQARRFVGAFREHRRKEAARADEVLALFGEDDVVTPAGHRAVLAGWARLEGLDRFVGASSYVSRDGRYVLPWPGE